MCKQQSKWKRGKEGNKMSIIEGSKSWTKVVPDEYAIKCIEQYPSSVNERDRILKFLFVTPACRLFGAGFVQMCGIANIPMNTEGIVILINDLSSMADIYFRNNEELNYGGQLSKCEISCATHKPPKFSKISHYSERNIEKQKSDSDAPDWLKEFAKVHTGSNVAYFEF